MSQNTVNLKYATNNHSFFSNLRLMENIIKDHKKSNPIATFDQRDETEIGRSTGYAVFPELKAQVQAGTPISVDDFRHALAQRGIYNPAMQNKILNFTLQNKAGLQFAMGGIVSALMAEAQLAMAMNHNYQLNIEVNGPDDVTLVFDGVWEDVTVEPREPAVSAHVEINITPSKILITDFNLTQVGDSAAANQAHDYLLSNQQNILMKLLTFIKHLFGFNAELRLEQENKEDQSWVVPNNCSV